MLNLVKDRTKLAFLEKHLPPLYMSESMRLSVEAGKEIVPRGIYESNEKK